MTIQKDSTRSQVRLFLFNNPGMFVTLAEILKGIGMRKTDRNVMRVRNSLWPMVQAGEFKMVKNKGYKITNLGQQIVRETGLLTLDPDAEQTPVQKTIAKKNKEASMLRTETKPPKAAPAPAVTVPAMRTLEAEIPAPKATAKILGAFAKIEQKNAETLKAIDEAIAALQAQRKQIAGE